MSETFDSPLHLNAGDRREATRAAPFLVATLIVGIAVIGSLASRGLNDREQRTIAEGRTQTAVTLIDRRMDAYVDLLTAARAFFVHDPGGSTAIEFEEFIDDLDADRRYPGMQMIGVAKAAPDANWAEGGNPITIVLAEPAEGNESVLGFDLTSEAVRRLALERARDTGTVAATAPITLVQEVAAQRGFALMLPMYSSGEVPTSIADRRAQFAGVVVASFRMGDLMAGVFGGDLHSIDVEVYDAAVSVGFDSTSLMYADNPDALDAATVASHSAHLATMSLGGRTWSVYFDSKTPILSTAQRTRPAAILVVGILLGVLVAVLVRNIQSSKVRAERVALAMNSELRGLTEATSEAVVTVDGRGRILSWNGGAERTFGYTRDQAMGQSMGMLMTPDVRDAYVQRLVDLDAGAPGPEWQRLLGHQTIEMTALRKDGREVAVELSLSTWATRGERYYTGILRDISDRVEVERAQALALERERDLVVKLRELDAAKAEFVSSVSHELRTPLTSILGFTELLLDDLAEDDDGRPMLHTIERNAHRLLSLVEDLLTLSKMESGKFRLAVGPVDLEETVRAAAHALLPMATARGLDLDIEIPVALPPLTGDRSQLERVVLNLLSNAIKVTHPGGRVVVAAAVVGTEFVLTVTDTGIGIPAAEVDQLFSRFFRTSASRQHAIQGTGLGLAIVSNIVEQHGGRIGVESVEGAGTTFTVRIPASPPPATVDGDRSLDGATEEVSS